MARYDHYGRKLPGFFSQLGSAIVLFLMAIGFIIYLVAESLGGWLFLIIGVAVIATVIDNRRKVKADAEKARRAKAAERIRNRK